METDMHVFLEFYRRVGLLLEPKQHDGENIIFIIGTNKWDLGNFMDDDRFNGYGGFYTDIEFTPEGKFVRQGFWE